MELSPTEALVLGSSLPRRQVIYGQNMPHQYSQRSLTVLSLLGILSAIMSLLSATLIFQLQSQQTAVKESSHTTSMLPAKVWVVLLPVSTVLCALSLTLNLSSVAVCLLHSYFTTEICRGEEDTDRADWFLLDSRAVRHVAIGLFCLGISVYLSAMSIYMLLVFEVETGIASACVLFSGVLVLLVIVTHSLVKASRAAGHYHGNCPDALYQNDHGGGGQRPCEVSQEGEEPRRQRGQSHLPRQFSYPPCAELKQQQFSLPSGPQSLASDGGGSAARMHRTLSTESALLQAQAKPWNGINNEMRSVLARKSGASSKDSTLV